MCHLRAASAWLISPAVTCKKISHLVSADSFDGRRRPLGSGMNGSSEVTREDCQPWVISHPDLCGEVRRKPASSADSLCAAGVVTCSLSHVALMLPAPVTP